mmetsp:Transcript_8350/g.12861  ORF Transcript_8350/g.12861 Transcript_8350/m.12861 type:complete len:319 (+) Transcript_8350:153-1109(+)
MNDTSVKAPKHFSPLMPTRKQRKSSFLLKLGNLRSTDDNNKGIQDNSNSNDRKFHGPSKTLSLPIQKGENSLYAQMVRTNSLQSSKESEERVASEFHFGTRNSLRIYLLEQEKGKSCIYKSPTFEQDLALSLEAEKEESCSEFTIDHRDITQVRFDHVTIYEFPMIIGDHPGQSGIPVTIDWEPECITQIAMDKYEHFRSGHRRTRQEMHLSRMHRERILREHGDFTRSEMNKALKGANQTRMQRRSTSRNLRFSKVHETMEYVGSNLRNAAVLGRRKRKEQQFLQQYVPNYCVDGDSKGEQNASMEESQDTAASTLA